MRKFVVCLLLVCMCGLPAQAITTYVSTTGADINTCGAGVGSPKLTIAACAACNTTPGDICQIEGGVLAASPFVYTANLDSTVTTLVNGTLANPMILKVTPGEFVVIRPSATVCEVLNLASTQHWTIDGNSGGTNRDGLILDGLNLGCGSSATHVLQAGLNSFGIWAKNLTVYRARNSGTSFAQGVSQGSSVTATSIGSNFRMTNFLSNPDYPEGATNQSHGMYLGQKGGGIWIEQCEVKNAGSVGIQFNHSNFAGPAHTLSLIERCSIHDNGKQAGQGAKNGIVMENDHASWIVRNNLVYNNPGTGISTYGSRNAGGKIYNNTIWNNGGAGIALGTFTDLNTTDVKNNLVFANGEGIHIYQYADNTVVDTNLIWKAPSGYTTPIVDSGVGSTKTGTIVGNPALMNIGSIPPDLHLGPTSQALNAGLDLIATVPDDFAGTARTAHAGGDTLFEVGAYTVVAEVLPLHLEFSTVPASGTLVDATFSVAVKIVDSAGSHQTTLNSGDITLSLFTGTGTLNGTLVMTPVSGTSTFPGLSINAADDDFVIQAERAGTTLGRTANFTIVTATPTPQVIRVAP